MTTEQHTTNPNITRKPNPDIEMPNGIVIHTEQGPFLKWEDAFDFVENPTRQSGTIAKCPVTNTVYELHMPVSECESHGTMTDIHGISTEMSIPTTDRGEALDLVDELAEYNASLHLTSVGKTIADY
jgi:hypothetical protein